MAQTLSSSGGVGEFQEFVVVCAGGGGFPCEKGYEDAGLGIRRIGGVL